MDGCLLTFCILANSAVKSGRVLIDLRVRTHDNFIVLPHWEARQPVP